MALCQSRRSGNRSASDVARDGLQGVTPMDSLNAIDNHGALVVVEGKDMGAARAVPKARQLTAERAREVLNYDPETGAMTVKLWRPGCRKAGELAGTLYRGYWRIQIDGKLYKRSRLAWLMMTGAWPRHFIDHIDGNRSDDRWCNLREATPAQNARNRGKSNRNTSGKVGVHPVKATGKWGAEICVNGRNLKLGAFECRADAVAARCEAERHHFGAFARGAQ